MGTVIAQRTFAIFSIGVQNYTVITANEALREVT